MSGLMKLLSLDEIVRHPEMLAKQPPQEIRETKIACSAALAALNAAEGDTGATAGNPAVPAEEWIGPAEACILLDVDRRWLFRHKESLPFIKRLSRKKLLVNKTGALAWLKAGTRRRG